MIFHIFNKKISMKSIEKAREYSSSQEQLDYLALATTPKRGEIWKSPTGRVIVIRSNDILIQNVQSENYIDLYGCVVADLIGNQLEPDFDLFFTFRELINYKKIGTLKKKLKKV